MARRKLGKVKKSIGFPPEMVEELSVKAQTMGIGWTTLVPMLCRAQLDLDKQAPAK